MNDKAYKKKKILFFCKHLKQGGAEKVCMDMIKRYLCMGIKVDVITASDDDVIISDEKFGRLSLGIGKDENDIRRIRKILGMKKAIDAFIQREESTYRYALITAHLPIGHFLASISKVRDKTLYVLHNEMDKENKYKLPIIVYRFMIRNVYKNRFLVTVSKELKKQAVNIYKLDKRRVDDIYNPINISEIQKMSKEEVSYSRDYFLSVGRLAAQKRIDRLLDIFKEGRYYEKYDLLIVGDGELRNELESYARDLGLSSSVRFIGYDENPYKWMANCELMVVTSDYESFCLVVAEALVCGASVISADCDYGPREILIGNLKNNLVKEYTDVEKYVDVINSVLLKRKEKNFDGSKLCSRYDVDYICKKYLRVYKERILDGK